MIEGIVPQCSLKVKDLKSEKGHQPRHSKAGMGTYWKVKLSRNTDGASITTVVGSKSDSKGSSSDVG